MSSFLEKPSDVKRNWYIIDASGKSAGRVAALAASLLRGKHKPTFTPNVDCGDHVIVINCENIVLTGKKLDQKSYYRHSGYVGGLKEVKARDLMRKDPSKIVEIAIRGMVPDTTIGRSALTRLRVYNNAEHKHAAQKPEIWE
ncbi:MAG: 50S ribosomal protein L13 [Clostridia bacterium]|nr:50S ribosomal protein L13 [Clostridia bacterium]